MELRVVELAHAKGLTMADIAKQIGISRVNLSNSLNGNPTLSRLTEVANILGVEVSELFKPASTQKVVSGYLECDGRIVKVDSLDAVKRFVAEVEKILVNVGE
ncbi:MAG: helix-turn-helix transcriptional regulator [Alistipes sp.]|jgi:transcriptional regulator with XRE-family HTH domain|nr:helix-turn-helix transcriptional regulator [Alistipes sp.]